MVACGPPGLEGGKNLLYHNNGDGTFKDVSEKAGFTAPSLPMGATVNLPHGACYLVSNSPTSLLIIHAKTMLTINGNGGDDALIVNEGFSGGLLDFPIAYSGGGQANDSLYVYGGTFTNVADSVASQARESASTVHTPWP